MNSMSTYAFPLFNKDTFTPILPFDDTNLLAKEVESDHAELNLKIANSYVMNIWNISNPSEHKYFKYGNNPAFKNTHLFVEYTDYVDVKALWLTEKIKSQIDTIAGRFARQEVSIQIIIEGYKSFYDELAKKILELGYGRFKIITSNSSKFTDWKSGWNITAIIVNTSLFSIDCEGCFCNHYIEESSKEDKWLDLPYTALTGKGKDNEKVKLFIIPVHVSSCSSQYPKKGIEVLAKQVYRIACLGEYDTIVAGDFSTSPENVKASFLKKFKQKGWPAFLLQAPYPTHVNSNSHAANYDQIAILKGISSTCFDILPPSSLSFSSQGLIASIEKSRIKYLTP